MQDPSTLPAYKLASLDPIPPGLSLVSGPRGAGKTTWCTALIAQARSAHLTVSGILCPAYLKNDTKLGIFLENIQTGERRLLGQRNLATEPTVRIGAWNFDPQVLAWGNAILQAAHGTDLTVIDELGPLEFEDGGGLQAGMQLLDRGDYRSACVVIRPELLEQARQRWPIARVIQITRGET